MGPKRSRLPRTIVVIFLVLIAAASIPGQATPSAGLVPEGVYSPCGKGDSQWRLVFSFAGRMPSDGRFYQVTSGSASGVAECYPLDVLLDLTLNGQTAKGTFQWACTGGLSAKLPGISLQVLNNVLENLGLSLFAYDPSPGPTYLLDAWCSTVGKGDRFRFRAWLEGFGDRNPDPYNADILLRGVFSTSVS